MVNHNGKTDTQEYVVSLTQIRLSLDYLYNCMCKIMHITYRSMIRATKILFLIIGNKRHRDNSFLPIEYRLRFFCILSLFFVTLRAYLVNLFQSAL